MSVIMPTQPNAPADEAVVGRGRQLTFWVLGAMLGADLLSTMTGMAFGYGHPVGSIIRLAIIAGLAFGTWRGNVPARWVLVILGFIGSGFLVLGLFAAFVFGPVYLLSSVLVAGAHIAGGVLLLTSEPIKAYLREQQLHP